jgi:hypothetical protein
MAYVALFALAACSPGSTDPPLHTAVTVGSSTTPPPGLTTPLSPTEADSDGDGLQDDDELALGLDPSNPDTDADRLADGTEVDLGTDPLVADTDGDSYVDGDEVREATDPLDAASVIYLGGWPYNWQKAALADPGWDGVVSKGALFPELVATDQFGQAVDLYDFANEADKPVVIDISTQWCEPCNNLAEYFSDDENTAYHYPKTRRAIEQGDVYWITVITYDNDDQVPAPQVCADWDEEHPNPNIPVLCVSTPTEIVDWIDLYSYPSIALLDSALTVDTFDRMNAYDGVKDLEASL